MFSFQYSDRRNNELFWEVKGKLIDVFGQQCRIANLLKFARDASDKLNLSLDRKASRNKDFLISWICENWETIEPFFNDNKSNYHDDDLKDAIPLNLTKAPTTDENTENEEEETDQIFTPHPKNRQQHIKSSRKIELRIKSSWEKMFGIQKVLEEIFQIKKAIKMPQLLEIALSTCKVINSIKLDRNAKRNKKVILAWFSENWEQILPHLETVKSEVYNNYKSISYPLNITETNIQKNDFLKSPSIVTSNESSEAVGSENDMSDDLLLLEQCEDFFISDVVDTSLDDSNDSLFNNLEFI